MPLFHSFAEVELEWDERQPLPLDSSDETTDFLPTNILLWEQSERDPFYFNDAGENPEVIGEGLSQRHATANGEDLAQSVARVVQLTS